MLSKFQILFILLPIFIIFALLSFKDEEKAHFTPLTEKCKLLDLSKKEKCFASSIEEILKNEGVGQSLEFLETIYNSEPDLTPSKGCHALAHIIGKEAYDLFSKSKSFNLTQNTAYCGYGFYHSFMESLIHEGQDLSLAKKFCEKADKELSKGAPDVRSNCFHGIGHGLIGDPPDSRIWGNEQAIINESLLPCLKISDKKADVDGCTDGTFDATLILMIKGEAGLTLHKTNVFQMCERQDDSKAIFPFKYNCYRQVGFRLPYIAKSQDILTVARYIDEVPDDVWANAIIFGAARNVIGFQTTKDKIPNLIKNCRKVAKRLKIGCLNGLEHAYMLLKGPGKAIDKALNFCKEQPLTESERQDCYRYQFETFRKYYPKETIISACKTIEKKHQKWCVNKKGNYLPEIKLDGTI